jgi:hypothetical protein
VESCHTPFKLADTDEKLKSILLSVAFDARATRDTLLNEAIREVHNEVDTWRETQRQALISSITNTIISDDPSTETLAVSVAPLDPRLQAWIDTKKSDLHLYTRSRLANQVCENTVEQQFAELIEERVLQHRRNLDADVLQRTADLQTAFDAELANCKSAFAKELDVAKLQLKKTLDADLDAARLDAHNQLIQEQGRLRHENKIKTQQLRDDLDSHNLTSVARTPKTDKPSPMSTRPKKLKKKSIRKTGILDLNTPPPPTDDEMVTDNESGTDTFHSPIASKAADPLPASRPTSTTPTQQIFEPKAESSDILPAPAFESPVPSRAPHAAAAPIPDPQTLASASPAAAPTSEIMMLFQAFTGFKTEVTTAITELNSKVLQLQSGNVPSSQPEELSSYYDDTYDETSNW